MPDVEVWVDVTANGGNPTGGDGSEGDPYGNWLEAESDTKPTYSNLVGNQQSIIYWCKSGTETRTAGKDIFGWTTDDTYKLRVYGAPGHECKGVDNGGYKVAGTFGGWLFRPYVHMEFRDIQIAHTGADSFSSRSIITENHIVANRVYFGPGGAGYRTVEVTTGSFEATACKFVDHKAARTEPAIYAPNATNPIKLYNCSFTKYQNGVNTAWSNVAREVYNCVSTKPGSTKDFSAVTSADHNASGDTTAPGTNTVHNLDETTAFTDYANDDLSLPAGSALIGAGNATWLPADNLDITLTPYASNDVGCHAASGAPSTGHNVDIPAIVVGNELPVPDIQVSVSHFIDVPAIVAATVLPAPDITVPIEHTSMLGYGISIGAAIPTPDVHVPLDHFVDLPAINAAVELPIPDTNVGADANVTLGNAIVAGVVLPAPDIVGEITHYVDVPAIVAGIDLPPPPTEGVSDLPPSIPVQTPNQVYTFGAVGVLPAPAHDIGTGANPSWSLVTDDFGNKPGVTLWSIDPVSGDIAYQVKQLTSDPDEQALNTKGPYSVTRRLTTTVGSADDAFKTMVNVGNRTIKITPGTPCKTWSSVMANGRALEPTKDPSNAVMQQYTVT